MTLALATLKNIFPLRKPIISSISMCYIKCYSVHIFHVKISFMLMNNIMSTTSGHDTLKTSRHLV